MSKKGSFLVKINIIVIGIVIGAVLTISSVFFYYLYGESRERAVNNLNKDLSQINEELSQNIEDVYHITNQLACDVELGHAVEDFYSDMISDTVKGKKMMDYIVQNSMAMNSSIENITLLVDGKVQQYDRYTIDKRNSMSEIEDAEWYEKLQKDQVSWVFESNPLYRNKVDDSQYFLCATKFKNKFYQNRVDENRMVIITFHLDKLESLIQNTANLKNMNFLLYAEDEGRVIYNKGVSESYEKLTEGWNENGVGDFSKLNEEFEVLETDNSVSGWKIKGFIERSVLVEMIYPMQTWLVAGVLITLAVSIASSILIFQSVSKVLKNVVHGMESFGKPGFYYLDEEKEYVEFHQIIRAFNQMASRIRELIRNIEEKEKEKRKEEFRVLEAQINPHFIYNTLDAIQWVALMNQSKPTADIIGSFVNFLRLSLSKGAGLIPVRKEIELTKEYINIMVFRNNFNVSVEYVVEEGVKGLYTLKLVLQPLVENCFIHAFDSTTRNPKITIRCYEQDNRLIMEVEDNGKGMDSAGSGQRTSLLTGIGMDNIEERIKLWHGEEYGLEKQPVETGGTRVIVTQPILVEKGGLE